MRISFLLLVLLLLPSVLSATISGAAYDLDLTEVHTAVVTIDTTPEQRMVAKDGTYAFTVPEGTYEIFAHAMIDGEEWAANESITVSTDGEYTFDLLLSPTFAELDALPLEELDDLTDLEETTTTSSPDLTIPIILATVILFVIVALTIHKIATRPRNAARIEEDDEFRSAVLAALRKHKGRITQKELRREVPFSEAKVSLVLTELENEGVIAKIKKGRGNVIVRK